MRQSLLRPVLMRNRDEPHRVSTPLELLFDLCFVVAIATLASQLHHDLAAQHFIDGAVTFCSLFVPVWWAWMSYTWYATAFDNGDLLFRLLTLAQMAGVLVVAAALPSAAEGRLMPVTLAYTAMRLPLIVQWLRAAHHDKVHRRFTLRYTTGSIVAQCLWLLGMTVPTPARVAVWAFALGTDLLTPVLATKVAPGRVFHAGHIAERYGLFALIVLGETILSVSMGIRDIIRAGSLNAETVVICASALITAFGVWWLYFDTLGRDALERHRKAAFIWGYGHALLYAAIAAIGAGVTAQLDTKSNVHAGWFTALPVSLSLVALALLQRSANLRHRSAVVLSSCAGVIWVVGASGAGPVAMGVACATCTASAVVAEMFRDNTPTDVLP